MSCPSESGRKILRAKGNGMTEKIYHGRVLFSSTGKTAVCDGILKSFK